MNLLSILPYFNEICKRSLSFINAGIESNIFVSRIMIYIQLNLISLLVKTSYAA